MVKKFEEPIGNRVNQIISEAEDRLNLFYKSYGEWTGEGKRPSRKSKGYKSKKNKVEDIAPHPICTIAPMAPGTTKVIYRPRVAPPEVVQQPPASKEAQTVSFKGMRSSDIIKEVKDLTGVAITVSIKSKSSVIRHALKILKEKGFTVINHG